MTGPSFDPGKGPERAFYPLRRRRCRAGVYSTNEMSSSISVNDTHGIGNLVQTPIAEGAQVVDRPLRIERQLDAGTVRINNWAVLYSETKGS